MQFAPAVLGVLKTDEVLSTTHATLAGMSKEYGDAQRTGTNVADDARLDLARVKLGAQVHHMTNNLAIVQKYLDAVKSTVGMTPDDAAAARNLRAAMQGVVAKQNDAINLVNGLVETELMGQMQLQHDHGMQSATGPESTHATAEPAPLAVAGVHVDSSSPIPGTRANLTGNTLGGHTPYDTTAGYLGSTQHEIAARESILAPAVVSAARACGGGQAPAALKSPKP